MKTWLKIAFLFWLLILVYLIWRQWPDNNLHLVFCDVGQGDAIVVCFKTVQILIDGGLPKNSGKLLKCLKSQMPFWDRKIEMVVNTHPDEDHFGGLLEIVKRYRVGLFLYNGFDNPESWRFQELKNELLEERICSRKLVNDESFRIKKIYFEVLWPEEEKADAQEKIQTKFFDQQKKCQQPGFDFSSDNLNNSSIVLQLRFGDFDALLTGDISISVEQVLAWRKQLPKVEVLKIAHHGSKTSTSEEILLATQPQLAVISVGENKFGHPTKEVLEKLKNHDIRYLRTDINGQIEIISDGRKWTRL